MQQVLTMMMTIIKMIVIIFIIIMKMILIKTFFNLHSLSMQLNVNLMG